MKPWFTTLQPTVFPDSFCLQHPPVAGAAHQFLCHRAPPRAPAAPGPVRLQFAAT